MSAHRPGGGGFEDARRHPLLDDAGRAVLRSMLEHPAAPRWNHACGERLDAEGVADVRRFAAEIASGRPAAAGWVAPFVERCRRTVPAYRHLPPGVTLADLPTTSRADLVGRPEAFVPDDAPLDDLIVHATSGTGGTPATVLQTPRVVAGYYPLLEAALAVHGVEVPCRPGEVGWVTVSHQRSTFVLASVSAYLGGMGTGKVNLHPDAWRAPEDRAVFLADCDPAVLTGDPVSLAALADLDADLHPVALVSTAMALLPGLAARLVARFDCPVVDVYSLAESGPIAVALPDGSGWRLLQPRLHVEVVDGEVVVTGGFNPLLPLLRYRTGDRASLEERGDEVVLVDLEGRAPVTLEAGDGSTVNAIDVTKALGRFALRQYGLHQAADRSLELRVRDLRAADEPRLRRTLVELFGTDVDVEVTGLDADHKVLTYTSDLI